MNAKFVFDYLSTTNQVLEILSLLWPGFWVSYALYYRNKYILIGSSILTLLFILVAIYAILAGIFINVYKEHLILMTISCFLGFLPFLKKKFSGGT